MMFCGSDKKYCVLTRANNGYVVNTFTPPKKNIVEINQAVFNRLAEMMENMHDSLPGDEWKGGGNADFKSNIKAISEEVNADAIPAYGTHIFAELTDAMRFIEKFIERSETPQSGVK